MYGLRSQRQVRFAVLLASLLVFCSLLLLVRIAPSTSQYVAVRQRIDQWQQLGYDFLASTTSKPSDWRGVQQLSVSKNITNGLQSDLFAGASIGADGLWYPPKNSNVSMNAAFVALVRNREANKMAETMKSLEERFNSKYNYPYIFLNDIPFTDHFKQKVQSMTSAEIHFGLVPPEHWSFPDWLSTQKAEQTRHQMQKQGTRYGGSKSYRQMCRYQSGFFFRYPLVEQLEYYWRIEPGVKFHCNIDYDVFRFMKMNNKTYGFNIALYENKDTVETLYSTTREFVRAHPEYLAGRNGISFLSDEPTTFLKDSGNWNYCHFWSNFEIAATSLWKSRAYMDYFDYLDKAGGFFYERWGDAPVHSMGAMLFQDIDKVHLFDDVGYFHDPYLHCPQSSALYSSRQCTCNKDKDIDKAKERTCIDQWQAALKS